MSSRCFVVRARLPCETQKGTCRVLVPGRGTVLKGKIWSWPSSQSEHLSLNNPSAPQSVFPWRRPVSSSDLRRPNPPDLNVSLIAALRHHNVSFWPSQKKLLLLMILQAIPESWREQAFAQQKQINSPGIIS